MNFRQKIASACAALSLNCHEASLARSERLDHRLPASRQLGLWLHLAICKWCRRYAQQLRFLHETAQTDRDGITASTSQKLPAEARDRIKRALRND